MTHINKFYEQFLYNNADKEIEVEEDTVDFDEVKDFNEDYFVSPSNNYSQEQPLDLSLIPEDLDAE